MTSWRPVQPRVFRRRSALLLVSDVIHLYIHVAYYDTADSAVLPVAITYWSDFGLQVASCSV